MEEESKERRQEAVHETELRMDKLRLWRALQTSVDSQMAIE